MKLLITSVFIVASTSSFCQKKFTTNVGISLGRHIQEDFIYNDRPVPSRISVSLSQYMNISERVSIGLEGLTSGILVLWSVGIQPLDGYDNSTNTTILDNNRFNSSNFAFIGRYKFNPKGDVKPFVSMGAGVVSYYAHPVPPQKVVSSRFSMRPEIGLSIRRFEVSCKFIFGGRTPSFSGFDSFRNTNVTLNSVSSQQFLVTYSYNLFNF